MSLARNFETLKMYAPNYQLQLMIQENFTILKLDILLWFRIINEYKTTNTTSFVVIFTVTCFDTKG